MGGTGRSCSLGRSCSGSRIAFSCSMRFVSLIFGIFGTTATMYLRWNIVSKQTLPAALKRTWTALQMQSLATVNTFPNKVCGKPAES